MIQQLLDVQFLFRAQIQKHRCALAHPHFLSLWTEYLCVFVCVNVRVCSAYIMNQNNIQSEQSYPNSSKIHELFLEKLIKVFKNTPTFSQCLCQGYVSSSGPTSKVNGVYSGLTPILRLSFVEIRSVGFFFCHPADKPTYQPTSKWTQV